jgi:hypothetical protein
MEFIRYSADNCDNTYLAARLRMRRFAFFKELLRNTAKVTLSPWAKRRVSSIKVVVFKGALHCAGEILRYAQNDSYPQG